jgi:leucyl-tRNA synthetase
VCQHLWQELGFGADILDASWPQVDESALVQDQIELVLQVNGKHRGSIPVPSKLDRAGIERLALESPHAQKHIAGQPVKKIIVVPGRLVNIVV